MSRKINQFTSAILLCVVIFVIAALGTLASAATTPPVNVQQIVAQAAAQAKPGNTIVPFGDSITAAAWSAISGTTLNRSGGVVTVTATGHPFQTGQSALVEQMSVASFNGFYTVTRINANSFSYVAAGPDGSASGGYIRSPYWLADNGWFNWARILLGNRLTVPYVAGVGGSSSADCVNGRFTTDVVARKPAFTTVMSGINDVGTLTAAQIFSNLQTCYSAARAAGITAIAMTILPLEVGHPAYSVANNQKIVDVNYRITQECLRNPGMICVNSYAAVVDPLSSTGQPRAGYLAIDHIHPSARGAYAIAQSFYKSVQYRIPAGNTLPSSASDNRIANPANANLWAYLPATATGGTLAGSATGTVPAGFKVQSVSGTPTVTASAVMRSVASDGDDLGYNCRMVVTPTAANDSASIAPSGSGWAATVATGKAYYLEAAINVTGVAGSNLSQIYATVTMVVDGVNYPLYVLQPTGGAYPAGDFQGVIQSVPFFLSGTTATNIVVNLVAKFSGAGTPITIDLGRVQVRELPAGSSLTY